MSPWLDVAEPAAASAIAGAFGAAPHRVTGDCVAVGLPLIHAQRLIDALPAALTSSVMPTAVEKRRHAYIAGRLCAERALRLLGMASARVDRGEQGEPVWPEGMCGSITHTNDWAYAAVVPSHLARGVGIDSEPVVDAGSCASIERLCCTAFERDRWLTGEDRHIAATVVFSAKEALYKALWPMARRWIDFDEVQVTAIEWPSGTAWLAAVADRSLAGTLPMTPCRFVIAGGVLHTACAL